MSESRETENNVMDFTQERKKLAQRKRMRLLRRILIPAVVALLLLAYVTGLVSFGISFVQDMVDAVRIAMLPAAEYPLQTGLAELYTVQELKGGFAALGPDGCVVYAAGGIRLRSIQTSYGRPGLSAGKNRFVLYNRSGTELRVESRTRTLYTRNTENGILTCSMSGNGTLAVATTHNRYTAELTLFSPAMDVRMVWDMAESKGVPLCMEFASDNNRLAVASLRASQGDALAGLYLVDAGKGSTRLLAEEPGAVPMAVCWQGGSRILVLYDAAAVVYHAGTGAEQYRYTYDGTLLDWSVQGQSLALLIENGDVPVLVLLDKTLQPTAETAAENARQVALTRTAAYVLEPEGVCCYALSGERQWLAPAAQTPQAVLDAKQLLVFEGGAVRLLSSPADDNHG